MTTPDATARRAVLSRDDLRVGDTVHDPVGGMTGRVVDLTPLGWADGSGTDRVTVQWRWAQWRSDPRVVELEKVVSGPAARPW